MNFILYILLSADGYSVYMKNLPMDATPAQLEEVFKKFGPIKPGGIQVRSHKVCIYFLSLKFKFQLSHHFFIFGIIRRLFFNYLQLQGFCFGFVEFEVTSAVQSAIEVNLYMPSVT